MSKSPDSQKVAELLRQGYEEPEIVDALVSRGVSRQRARSMVDEAGVSQSKEDNPDDQSRDTETGAEEEILSDGEQNSVVEKTPGTDRGVSSLRAFQGYCLSVIFAMSSVLYFWVQADISASYKPTSLISPLSLGLGIPLILVLAAMSLTSLYQVLRLNRLGLAPFFVSLALSVLYLLNPELLSSTSSPQNLIEPTASTASFLYYILKPNGMVALSGFGSVLLLRRRMGRLALPAVFLPLIVIALSWGVFALKLPDTTDPQVDPRYGADTHTGVNSRNLTFSRAAYTPPLANRELVLAATERMDPTASPIVSSGQELYSDQLRPESAPYTSCTYQRAGYAKSKGTALEQALDDWRYERRVAATDYFRKSLESLCSTEDSPCPSDINYSREQQRHAELARERQRQISSLMLAPSSETEIPGLDLNPACSGEEDTVTVKSVNCSGEAVTVSVEADGVTGPVTIADARLRNTSAARRTGVSLEPFSSDSASGTFRMETLPYTDASIDSDTYVQADLTYDGELAEQASIAVKCR